MTIINGYCTRAELLREIMSAEDQQAPNVIDDQVIDDAIQDASRAVDDYCGRQFYARTATLYLDVPKPYNRSLWFGDDVLAVQAASNGDGTALSSSDYYLWPRNAQAYAAIVLKESSNKSWSYSTAGDSEAVITIAASVGYVDRAASAASDPGAGLQIIGNTHRATLIKAQMFYRQRMGQDIKLKDSDWQDLLASYRRIVP